MGMSALEVRRRVMMAQPHEAVASGAVASFRTDVLSPLKMSFDLLPIQTGEGDPSPENVRPITGHDGFTRNGAGINLLNPDFNLYSVKYAYRVNNHVVPDGATARMTITDKDTSIDVSGCYLGFIESPYTGGGSPTHFNWCILNGSINSDLLNKHQGVACCGVFLYPNTQETFDKLLSRYNIMVELGSVAHDFEPYTGHSYETAFPTPPGTVYGGHVRDNGDGTGTLVVDMVGVDMGTLTWTYVTSDTVFYSSIANKKDGAAALLCSCYRTGGNTGYSTPDYAIGYSTNSSLLKRVFVSDPNYTNAKSFKEAVTGQTLIYRLATPATYTLSLTALQSLIGQNHVWVDNADSVSVEYWGH